MFYISIVKLGGMLSVFFFNSIHLLPLHWGSLVWEEETWQDKEVALLMIEFLKKIDTNHD